MLCHKIRNVNGGLLKIWLDQMTFLSGHWLLTGCYFWHWWVDMKVVAMALFLSSLIDYSNIHITTTTFVFVWHNNKFLLLQRSVSLNEKNFFWWDPSWVNRAFSSSLLNAVIARSHLPFFKIFLNFVYFCPNFQIFCHLFCTF